MQNFFCSLYTIGKHSLLNNQFIEIIKLGMDKIVDKQYVKGGHLISIQDAVNDVTQYCDNVGLRHELRMLCEQVLILIE